MTVIHQMLVNAHSLHEKGNHEVVPTNRWGNGFCEEATVVTPDPLGCTGEMCDGPACEGVLQRQDELRLFRRDHLLLLKSKPQL